MSLSIQAGAGTGKTRRIIDLILEELVDRRMEPTRILALTFTVKAANEMRERLADGLDRRGHGDPTLLLDRMEIGTIHSFASHILRQFPIEAGVPPDFEEDEGGLSASLFREIWPRWFRRNLPDFLDRVEPADLREFAIAACRPGVPWQVRPAPEWREMLSIGIRTMHGFLSRYDGIDQADNVRCMRAARYLVELFEEKGEPGKRDLLKGLKAPAAKKTIGFAGWTNEEWNTFRDLIDLGRAVLDTDDRLIARIMDWLRPFAELHREESARRGFVTLHGLLVHAVDLLRRHRDVRSHFKKRFQRIFVDEFQDTDPLQGELLMFLAEKADRLGAAWNEIEVEPGKLTIVGDPKQSIYLFRGADLDAYRAITTKLTSGREDLVEHLTVNRRSKPEIIRFINAACRGVMKVPEYEAIDSSGERGEGGKVEAIVFEDLSAAEARVAEAHAIADWIVVRAHKWGEVAILLRALKDAEVYTAALRERGIRFTIEGEKTFWQTPEVTDFINLLTAISQPAHETAVAGLLRSPLSAVSDRDLVRLVHAGALCPFDLEKVPDDLPRVRSIFGILRDLHARCRRLSVNELARAALVRLPLMEVWAATYRGEQAVSNLEKCMEAISGLESEDLGMAVSEIRRRVRQRDEEGESPLADERLDAVRIMSIHKAKGLEFPHVVVADLHRERANSREGPVLQEWLSGRVGFRIGAVCNSERHVVERSREKHRGEEEARLLYVALTRARDGLLLTGGKPSDRNFLGALLATPGVVRIDPPPRGESAATPRRTEQPDPEEEALRWKHRREEAGRHLLDAAIRTPSAPMDPEDREGWGQDGEQDDRTSPRTLGTECHAFLARMDLNDPPQPPGEVGNILIPFFKSKAFRSIQSASRLYREVPFVMEMEGAIWSGQIDVVYRGPKGWVVADYKTDREEHPERYASQKTVYTEAARRMLGLEMPPEFRLIYLRSGRSVKI